MMLIFLLFETPSADIREREDQCKLSAQSIVEIQKKYPDISRVINWAGVSFTEQDPSFSKEEKKALVDYIHKGPSGFMFFPNAVVVKEDLDGDGKVEYIADLIIKPAQPFYCGGVIAVMISKQDGFDIRVVSGPPTFKYRLILNFAFPDLDGDGMKEIAELYRLQENPENPTFDASYSILYKNDGMGFHEIYRRLNYDDLHFRDLNGDGKIEVLETRNETPISGKKEGKKDDYVPMGYLPPKWHWINVYEWDGSMLRMSNEKHLPFYLEQQKIYQKLNKEAKEKIAESREKGKGNRMFEEAAKTLKYYIDRIEMMKGKN
jgi:hypothetical protein